MYGGFSMSKLDRIYKISIISFLAIIATLSIVFTVRELLPKEYPYGTPVAVVFERNGTTQTSGGFGNAYVGGSYTIDNYKFRIGFKLEFIRDTPEPDNLRLIRIVLAEKT
jgi:hypothetical protein